MLEKYRAIKSDGIVLYTLGFLNTAVHRLALLMISPLSQTKSTRFI